MRQSRKMSHLEHSATLSDGPGKTGFSDFSLVHNCLPDLAIGQIELSTELVGIKLNHPVIINAVTGGAPDVAEVNAGLAELALKTGSIMAVGSQFSAIEDSSMEDTYKVVRQVNPNGIFLANLGAHASVRDAQIAVEMIGASALQIHLNVAQELIMAEGDRDFRGYLNNIAAIAAASSVPVIIKEVGCGIAREQAFALIEAGVAAIDVGGMGGTNFVAIEASRSKTDLASDLLNWGIPTAVSAVEVASIMPPEVDLIVSGGIRTPLDAVKSLAIGGKAVGIAGPIVRIMREQGLTTALNWFESFIDEIKFFMIMVGASRVEDLTNVPLIISGSSRDWLTARKIDILKFANR